MIAEIRRRDQMCATCNSPVAPPHHSRPLGTKQVHSTLIRHRIKPAAKQFTRRSRPVCIPPVPHVEIPSCNMWPTRNFIRKYMPKVVVEWYLNKPSSHLSISTNVGMVARLDSIKHGSPRPKRHGHSCLPPLAIHLLHSPSIFSSLPHPFPQRNHDYCKILSLPLRHACPFTHFLSCIIHSIQLPNSFTSYIPRPVPRSARYNNLDSPVYTRSLLFTRYRMHCSGLTLLSLS